MLSPESKPVQKIHRLEKHEVGYLVYRHGKPAFVVEKCPEEHKATMGNVLVLAPAKCVTPAEAMIMAMADALGFRPPSK